MKMKGDKCDHSKGGRVKISPLVKQSRNTEQDKGHDIDYLILLKATHDELISWITNLFKG